MAILVLLIFCVCIFVIYLLNGCVGVRLLVVVGDAIFMFTECIPTLHVLGGGEG